MTSTKNDYIIRKFVKEEEIEDEKKEKGREDEEFSVCPLLKQIKDCYECGYMLC